MSQNAVADPPPPGSYSWLWERYKRATAAQRKIASHARWGPHDVRNALRKQLEGCSTWPKSLRRRSYVAFYLMMMTDRGWCVRDPNADQPLIRDLSEIRTWNSVAWEDEEDARWAIHIMVDRFTALETTMGRNGITSPIDLSKAISLCFVGVGSLAACMESLDLVIQAFEEALQGERKSEEEQSRIAGLALLEGEG